VPRARLTLILFLIVPAALLAGCGNARTPVPSLTQPVTPHGLRTYTYSGVGIEFKAPANWRASGGDGKLLGTVSSGAAIVAVWRYAQPGRQPSTDAQLDRARTALIAVARARDPGLSVISSRITSFAGLPAVVLNATEQIADQLRRVRSIHMFGPGLEVVIDQYAPPNLFEAVDRAVFVPLGRSLTRVS
jgi:hypothetical protein